MGESVKVTVQRESLDGIAAQRVKCQGQTETKERGGGEGWGRRLDLGIWAFSSSF